jgi:hypothetical protein
MGEPVSLHFVRRRARAEANRLDAVDPTASYVVRRYKRRLYRWAVYRVVK